MSRPQTVEDLVTVASVNSISVRGDAKATLEIEEMIVTTVDLKQEVRFEKVFDDRRWRAGRRATASPIDRGRVRRADRQLRDLGRVPSNEPGRSNRIRAQAPASPQESFE